MTLGGFFLLFGGTRSGGRFGRKQKTRQSFGEENIGGGMNKRKKGLFGLE
jgi:hypothetical protein